MVSEKIEHIYIMHQKLLKKIYDKEIRNKCDLLRKDFLKCFE